MDIVISGASGLIGAALTTALPAAGHRPIALVRRPPEGDEIRWDPDRGEIDAASLEGIGGVVHLAGAGIGDHRWTDEYKLEILRSRTTGTVLISGTLATLSRPPSVLVSGSAVGYYGDRGDEPVDEASPAGDGFLSEVCVAWEAGTLAVEEAGIRVAHIRSGVVLSAEGGALKKQLPLFKAGAGGKMGSGRQWQSWISIDDEVAAIIHLLDGDTAGPVNLTAPNPVTNAEFTKTLAHVLGRPSFLPVPSFAPKLLLGAELAETLLFTGQRVLPGVLSRSGFQFQHPTLEVALRSVLGKPAAA
ncbi:MAG TPA: TIGR01777 family oxidoreductase [Acidimicrobiales bacterium]|nr:TIGR01777 family oxidoreductase [Acidimicrobiales bacterium]